MSPKPKLLIARMSRQTAASLASARSFRRPIRDSVLHRDVKSIIAIRLGVMQRAFVFFSRYQLEKKIAKTKSEKTHCV